LKKMEITRLDKSVKEKGLTIIPLKLFFSERGHAKIEIGLCRGKKLFDKREDLKSKDAKKQIRKEF
ncbi:MAG: SsrA-binding protein, partial [Bacteroidetes bacterium]|nr:SsrA-binding protein [Bacteroidota bacterium]